ncbi:MAG: DUF5666 domain-containing protein [Chloroflexota bacterium]
MKNNFVTWRRFPLFRLMLAAMLSLASITTLVNTQPVYASPALQSESDATQEPMEDGEGEDGDEATQDPVEDGDDEDGDDEDGDDEDGDDEDGDDEDEDENEAYGTVESMPTESLIGNWTVDGVQYVATESTEFEEEDGAFAVGASVELEFTVVDGVNQLDEIETHSESDMDSTDDAETNESAQADANSYTVENSNDLVTLARAFGIDIQNILLQPTTIQ